MDMRIGFTRWIPMFLAIAVPAWCQEPSNPPSAQCPEDNDPTLIEVLPFYSTNINSCDFKQNNVPEYISKTCSIPNVKYNRNDAIYKVWLHPGNSAVRFQLSSPADLVLALLRDCKNPLSCVSTSLDFIDPPNEEIPAATYKDDGYYYLVIDAADSAKVPCGIYTLVVTGINPTPDLRAKLSVEPTVTVNAGKTIVYTLEVTNHGPLKATNVRLIHSILDGGSGVTFVPDKSSPNCKLIGGMVDCFVGMVERDALPAKRTITYSVNAAKRGVIRTSLVAKAAEGDPIPDDNEATAEVTVVGSSDLSITTKASQKSVIAGGDPLTYSVEVYNGGPSVAKEAKVTAQVRGTDAKLLTPTGCQGSNGVVTCTLTNIKVHQTKEIPLIAEVRPSASATSTLTSEVSVAINRLGESDPDTVKNNLSIAPFDVNRMTKLSISKSGPSAKNAGDSTALIYDITITNNGPSESDTAVVMDKLPAGITFTPYLKNCGASSFDHADCEARAGEVTCHLDRLLTNSCKILQFTGNIPPSQPTATFSNTAEVKSLSTEEPDPYPDDNVSKPAVVTSVKIKADLILTMDVKRLQGFACDSTPPPTVNAGENLLYSIKVHNNGPSNSRNTSITTGPLDSMFSFVASPDACTHDTTTKKVTCPLRALSLDEEATARFVVALNPAAKIPIQVNALVRGEDDYNQDNVASVNVDVSQAADLLVDLSDSLDPVASGDTFKYTLNITNSGPSLTSDVTAEFMFSEKVEVSCSGCNCSGLGATDTVRCQIGQVPAGASVPLELNILAVSLNKSPLTATATVSEDPDIDCTSTNNMSEETTTLAKPTDTDLSVTKTAEVESVAAGDLLRYTIAVTNNGPSKTVVEAKIQDILPTGLIFDSVAQDCNVFDLSTATYSLGSLPMGDTKVCVLIVKVDPSFTGTSIHNSVSILKSISNPIEDPIESNNEDPEDTTILHVPPLVLPYFEVVGTSSPDLDLATLLAVRNPNAGVNVQYDYVTVPPAKPVPATHLAGKATQTMNLRDLTALSGRTGYVGITPIPLLPNDAPLAGDFIRIDPRQATASGELLVSTDTSRNPPELCESWSVRFLRARPVGTSTELLFFVPGNSDTPGKAVARGRVFAESGMFVQEVEVNSSEEAFRYTINAEDNGGLPLLADSGSIEWTFRDGLAGHVTAIHKLAAGELKDEFAVPGFCHRALKEGSSSLILPSFEVDRSKPDGLTTYFAVHNETEDSILLQISYFDDTGKPSNINPQKIPLRGHEISTVDLRNVLAVEGISKGFVQIKATFPPADPELSRVLSGDYVRVDPARGLAGGALVEDNKDRSPKQLCRKWDVRFVEFPSLGSTTDFVFYYSTPPTKDPMATGTAYDEQGNNPKGILVSLSPSVSFLRSAKDLGLAGSGSVEWDLGVDATGQDVKGHVAMLFIGMGAERRRYSVLIPGVCRD
jgi:uncharacterized repeat protein (TIGR01451 family)